MPVITRSAARTTALCPIPAPIPAAAPEPDGRSASAKLLDAWHALEKSLPHADGTVPSSVPAMCRRLSRLGFTRVPATAGDERTLEYRGGGELRLRVRAVEAAGQAGVKVEAVADGGARALAGKLGMTILSDLVFDRAYWRQFEGRRDTLLTRHERALEKSSRVPRSLGSLKDLLALGRPAPEREVRAQRLAELTAKQEALATQVQRMVAEGRAPRAVLIYTEGPDAAGKTSTGQLLRPVFQAAGFRFKEHAFKAPTPAERDEHWLTRFRRQLPAEGEVMRWDRGPAGNVAYVEHAPASLRKLTGEYESLLQELRDENVLVLQYYLRRDVERQASTFGGREARAQIAREILASGQLAPQHIPGVEAVVHSIGLQDLRASLSFHTFDGRFKDFVERTGVIYPWANIKTNVRHEARLAALDAAERALEQYEDDASARVEDEANKRPRRA